MNFPFGTNGKFIILGVPILKHIRVLHQNDNAAVNILNFAVSFSIFSAIFAKLEGHLFLLSVCFPEGRNPSKKWVAQTIINILKLVVSSPFFSAIFAKRAVFFTFRVLPRGTKPFQKVGQLFQERV